MSPENERDLLNANLVAKAEADVGPLFDLARDEDAAAPGN